MENRIEISNNYSDLQKNYDFMKMLHLNDGRGFGIFSASDFSLLKTNDEYDNFLKKYYGKNGTLIGKNLFELSSALKDDAHLALFIKSKKNSIPICINKFKLLSFNNSENILNLTLIPLYDENKSLKYIIESFSDITKAEKQKEFFAYICHEFKTPLTVILSAVQAMKVICKEELSPRSLKYIRKIHQGSLQQWRLVNHLLDILKSESGYLKCYKKNLDIVKMTEGISEAVSIYANTKGVKLEFFSSISNLIIAIDDEKYERILLNLLSNAIKYTPAGHSISVIVDREETQVKISVKDTGIGISDQDINNIFELFSQAENTLIRKTEGTGIGLHLVKELVAALNGTITVKSRLNIGSIFTLFLPIETVEEKSDLHLHNLEDNRLIDVTNIEFSNIYFD